MKLSQSVLVAIVLLSNQLKASGGAGAAPARTPCAIELHSRNQIHSAIKTICPNVPDPLIEIIKNYIARTNNWNQSNTLDLNDGQKRTVHSMVVLSPNELAVSYMHDAHEAMVVPSAVSYAKVWNLTTAKATDFPLPSFVAGVLLPRDRVAVIVDSSTIVPIYNKTARTVEERMHFGKHKKHAVASLAVSAPSQLIAGLHSGALKVGDISEPNKKLITIDEHPADQAQHPELIAHNTAQAVYPLSNNRAIVGKKCGQLRILDLPIDGEVPAGWSDELVAQSEPRTIVRKIVGWPNDKVAVLRGHDHDEGHVQIWDAAGNGVLLKTVVDSKKSSLRDIIAMPDNTLAIANGAQIELVEIDGDTSDVAERRLNNGAQITCLASPHGDQIAAGLATGQVQLWDRVTCAACANSS